MSAFRWTRERVAAALDAGMPAELPDDFAGVSTDTRALTPGSLFVALAGERFDAHDYLDAAAAAGAAAAVVSRVPAGAPADLPLVTIGDTLAALGRLARHRRRALEARVVGIAGSNGKTTCKDLLRAAVARHRTTHATAGNLNNQIGVPLTLLAAPDEAEVVIVEMGTNEPGEVEILTRIVEPDIGVITSIGEEHLEKLGSLDGVLEEELALLPGIRGDGPAFVADEPSALADRARALLGDPRVLAAGFTPDAELRPEGGAAGVRILEDGSTRWSWEGADVHLPLPGRHNVRNALLALGVTRDLGVAPVDAAEGISCMPCPALRGEWRRIGSLRVLADCYNANPPSTLAALDLLASLPGEAPRVAVLGTMRELGEHSAGEHRRVAAEVAGRLGDGIDRIVATGEFADAFDSDERVLRCLDPVDAYRRTIPLLEGGEIVLLKASRGETLERWLDLLEADFGASPPVPVRAEGG